MASVTVRAALRKQRPTIGRITKLSETTGSGRTESFCIHEATPSMPTRGTTPSMDASRSLSGQIGYRVILTGRTMHRLVGSSDGECRVKPHPSVMTTTTSPGSCRGLISEALRWSTLRSATQC